MVNRVLVGAVRVGLASRRGVGGSGRRRGGRQVDGRVEVNRSLHRQPHGEEAQEEDDHDRESDRGLDQRLPAPPSPTAHGW